MDTPLPTEPRPTSQLLARKRTAFRFAPDKGQRAAIATSLGLLDLPGFTFDGEITTEARGELKLQAKLAARAVQACVVTLAPVPVSLSEAVLRRYLDDWQDPQGDEVEIPEDDTVEALPAVIDIAAVAIEALALALPLYPRAKGAELGAVEFPPAGEPAADAEDGRKPLAGLAALLGRKDPSA
jgi:uncharacterized metal-binding protein YceD (DUF177 family)